MTNLDSCFYCKKDQRLHNLMKEVIEMQVSTLYLNKDQTHKGRAIIALNEHKNELFDLNQSDLNLFMEDVSHAAEALKSAFGADKINYAIYGDLVSHLHFHLVPKYKDSIEWGKAFTNTPSNPASANNRIFPNRIDLLKSTLVKTNV